MMSDLEHTTGAWSSRSTQHEEQTLEYGRGKGGKLKSQFFCLDWDGVDLMQGKCNKSFQT